mgnify:CR=1 FL=1
MKEDRRVIIYGAGDYGKKLLNILNDCGVKVDYFCQTEVEEKEYTVQGICVLSIKQLFQMPGTKIILIAIKDTKTSQQIKRELEKYAEEILVYECGRFIEQNAGKYCMICDTYVNHFGSTGIKGKIFEEHHIIGGGYRENAVCPYCHGIDRERWEMYVLSHYTDIFEASSRILHFAPEENIQNKIKSNEKNDYYACDLMEGKAMHMIDVTDIPFMDNTFDYIIINHVLEHVPDEGKAMSEMIRVLKPNGKIIMSFPICTDQKTMEDKRIKTPEERLCYYGQEDHVRLYGSDYKERLEQYGVEFNVYSPENECSDMEIEKYGFIRDDIILIGRIPEKAERVL